MKSIFNILVTLFIVNSCTSLNESTSDKFDIPVILVQSDTSHSISDSELEIVLSLFKKNDLSLTNLQVYRFDIDNQVGRFHVKCNQFYNNLPVLFYNVIFHFNEDSIYYSISGQLITNIDILFSPQIPKEEAAKTAHEFLQSKEKYISELGIFDSSIVTNADNEPYFELVWKIKLDETTEYPFAIISAFNGEFLLYDSGFRP